MAQQTSSTRRSRSGCWNCRSKNVKKRCDQQRPACGRCLRLDLDCDYSPRPTLAERRRAIRRFTPAISDEQPDNDEATTLSSSDNYDTSSPPVSLSIMNVSPPETSVCSLDLSNEDHEAIRYFRTDFARVHHTKNPQYSLISLMFKIAVQEPMVMHMVVAIGLQEMELRRPSSCASNERYPVRHYSAALRSMADAIAPQAHAPKDLDIVLTTLWLMLLYEQQFGDSRCRAYLSHLQGVSSLLQSRGSHLLRIQSCRYDITEKASLALQNSNSKTPAKPSISIYSARVLIWIVLLDAAAATSGVGGQVNDAILELLLSNHAATTARSKNPIKAIARLHHYSNSLYRLAWGDSYPQAEMLDDVENRNIYALLGHCAYLRYKTAQLATFYRKDPTGALRNAREVEDSIEEVGERFIELMEVASELSIQTDNSHRLVANIRAIVPMYYAVVLDFLRLTAFDLPLDERQRYTMREIMNLCYQSFKHSGDDAMMRVAWPLFIVALETDDMLHRDWILERFAALGKYGHNFERAHSFLVETLSIQQRLGRRVDLRSQMEKMELFVLG